MQNWGNIGTAATLQIPGVDDRPPPACRFDLPESAATGNPPAMPADAGFAQPLRILHLNSKLDGGGTDDQCLRLAEALHLFGHSVWIAGPDDQELSTLVRNLGMCLHVIPSAGHSKLKYILSAAALIRRERMQIVHAHHGRDIWPAVLAARLSGARPAVVITRHMAKSPRSLLSRRYLLSQCDALIAVSSFTARILREGVFEPASTEADRRARPPLCGDHSKIRVVYGGIDTHRFQPFDASQQRRAWGLLPEHFVFAVAGGYDFPRGKGQREFLQAAARIHNDIPRARFLLIGRGNMQAVLQDDIQRLGLDAKVQLVPHCSDMPVVMNAVDCLVHPAVGTEAFGLVVCEAHACGRPVIASALDGIPEAFQVGGCGSLVRPGDVDELAAAMRTWAMQPAVGEAARWDIHRKIAQRLSITNSARQVLAIYQSLLPDGNPVSAYVPLPEAKSGMLNP